MVVRSASVLIMTMTFALVVGACGRPGEEAMSPTADEITVYSNMLPDQIATYLAVFQVEYPNITVNVVQDSLGTLAKRLFDERQAPQADVIWGMSATNLAFLDWYDLLAPYAPVGLDLVSPQFRDVTHPPHWVGFDAWMSAFCVNTVVLNRLNLPAPQSWQALANPAYARRLVMFNPSLTGTGYMSIAAILQLYGESKGWELLDALHRNIAMYTVDRNPCEVVSSGDFPIGISYGLEGLTNKAEGISLDIIFPTEGSGWDMEASALVRKTTIKPAAKTFLDWAISDNAMREYAKNYAVTARVVDFTPKDFPYDPHAQLIDKDFPWASANRARILNAWRQRGDEQVHPNKTGVLQDIQRERGTSESPNNVTPKR